MPEASAKPSKIKPHTARWERLADALARDYAPRIYPCGKCGYPVVEGYCCTACGDSAPYKSK